MTDYEVIEAFVKHLQEHGYPRLKICRYPDQENRSSSDIEAIACPFAIEHTSIDTLPNQRRNNDWFIQVIGDLEQEFESQLSFRISIMFPYDAATKGKGRDRIAIRKALKSWILEKSPHLEFGKHDLTNIPGIPFQLKVDKRTSHIPGVAFWRSKPVSVILNAFFSVFVGSRLLMKSGSPNRKRRFSISFSGFWSASKTLIVK